MQREMFKKLKQEFTSLTLPKYGALFLLLVLSIAVVACGASGGNTVAAASPSPTTTPIHLFNDNLSPTPTVPAITCGIWITDPSIPSGSSFNIYGKFSRNVNGNPVGYDGGSATLTIQWGDGSTMSYPANITATGLTVTSISSAGHASALNKLSLVTATFASGNDTCQVGTDRPASFTLTTGLAPAKTAVPTAPGGGNNGGGRKHG
jgi:hypothetical protein